MALEQDVVGMDKDAAVKLITGKGFKCRTRKEDGEAFMGTMEVNLKRVNIEVVKGKVVKANVG